MIRKVVDFARERLELANRAPASEYRDGYTTALKEIDEFIVDLAWEEAGEDLAE